LVQQTLINGRYEIVRELGAGGSGCVYAATDRTTDKRVAVKVFGRHIRWDRAAREKFELEARVAGRVESEHIVQVIDAGLDPTTQLPFLVMELLQGKNLQDLVEQEGRISPGLTVDYLKRVASGLDKAHSWKDHDGLAAPIVHRDLKPSNLFLAHNEEGLPLVKILDWGIAKVLSSSATLSGDIRGTPLYMAPEQLMQAPVTPVTDIWALGLVAFFLLTGGCYWRSGQRPDAVLPAIIKEVCDGPLIAPRVRILELAVDVTLTQEFDDWFFHCVNLDPTQRFPRAGEAICELASVLNVAILQSRPTTVGEHGNNDNQRAIGAAPLANSENFQQIALAPETDSVSPSNSSIGSPRPQNVAQIVAGALFGIVLLSTFVVFIGRGTRPTHALTLRSNLVSAPKISLPLPTSRDGLSLASMQSLAFGAPRGPTRMLPAPRTLRNVSKSWAAGGAANIPPPSAIAPDSGVPSTSGPASENANSAPTSSAQAWSNPNPYSYQ